MDLENSQTNFWRLYAITDEKSDESSRPHTKLLFAYLYFKERKLPRYCHCHLHQQSRAQVKSLAWQGIEPTYSYSQVKAFCLYYLTLLYLYFRWKQFVCKAVCLGGGWESVWALRQLPNSIVIAVCHLLHLQHRVSKTSCCHTRVHSEVNTLCTLNIVHGAENIVCKPMSTSNENPMSRLAKVPMSFQNAF